MLQQTRVDAVLPYYNRWIEKFPTLEHLAEAELHDVLKQWEGLGYYSRARNLHTAARVVRERHNGAVPNTYDTLRALPGVGDYTAGAILSIAHNQPAPAVDGNVRRVLSRLFDVDASTAELRNRASELCDTERPGDFNQALMELGATVCTPRSPNCNACPLAASCLALRNNTVELRPAVKQAKQIPHYRATVLINVFRGDVILAQRPASGLLAGMFEFPSCERLPASARALGEVTHTFSHQRITYVAHLSKRGRALRSNEIRVALDQLKEYPLPKAQRRIEQLLKAALRSHSTA